MRNYLFILSVNIVKNALVSELPCIFLTKGISSVNLSLVSSVLKKSPAEVKVLRQSYGLWGEQD